MRIFLYLLEAMDIVEELRHYLVFINALQLNIEQMLYYQDLEYYDVYITIGCFEKPDISLYRRCITTVPYIFNKLWTMPGTMVGTLNLTAYNGYITYAKSIMLTMTLVDKKYIGRYEYLEDKQIFTGNNLAKNVETVNHDCKKYINNFVGCLYTTLNKTTSKKLERDSYRGIKICNRGTLKGVSNTRYSVIESLL